jgi:superfamily II RNA helicase
VVISSESFVDFITKDINRRFVEALRFVVFDEVHLPAVSQGLWWVQFIPQSAQLVLLSATLGNKRYLTKIIAKMYGYTDQDDSSSESTDDQDDSSSDDQDDSSSDDQDDSSSESTDESLERYTMPGALRSIVTIKYHIRPIPLQYAVYTESLAPQKGLMSPELVRAGKISCIVNPYDPTVRDTLSIDKKAVIPQGRDAQHQASLQVVSDNLSNVKVNIKEAIARAVQDSDAATVYNLLAYLFSNDMQPVMVFSVTAENTQSLAEALVSHITQTESSDPVYRSARKLEEKYERAGHRSRDEDGHGAASAVKADKATERSMQRAKDKVRGEIEDEDLSVINIHEVRATLKRWRFPMELESFPRKCPQWIQDAMECGIGVYTSTMPNWLRHHVFDVFKAGKIRVILADSSISVGINLPIRTCILCGDDMTPVVFRQASGRAGRRGYDTQGYVIPLCSRKLIARCFMERLTDVNISLPEAMSYSSLIRLSIPVNLDNFYRSEKFREQREPVSEYKTGIMERYLGTLDKAGRELYHAQMSLIEKEGWNYHRLSNLIKNLPGESNMIIIRLLVTGTLHKFTWQEFVDLLSVVMFRVEDSSGSVPTFERFARMTDFLQSFADRYGIKVDYRKPISDYLQRFMVDGVLDVSRLPEIEALGEWLYVMKREVNCVAPVHDDFRKLINQVDDFYIRARRRRNF